MVLNRFYTNEKVGGWVRRKALGEWVRQCDGCRRFDPEDGFPAGGAGLPPRPLRRRGSCIAFIINGIAALVTAKFIWPEVRRAGF